MCRHPKFDPLIMGFIIANTIVMAIRFDGMPEDMKTVLEYMNYVFAIISMRR